MEDDAQGGKDAFIQRDVAVDISGPSRTLNLKPFANGIQRKDGGFGHDTGKDSGKGVARANREAHASQRDLERLVAGEKQAHVWHNLTDGRADALKETSGSFIVHDLPDTADDAMVYLFGALRREAGSKKIQRVSRGGGNAASEGTADERLDGVWETQVWREAMEEVGGVAVDGELCSSVRDVQELGGDVAFPESLGR